VGYGVGCEPVGDGVDGMARYEYDDFWVEFSPREGGDYDVTLRAPGGETASETFHLPFTADELTDAVRTIGYTRSRAAAPPSPPPAPSPAGADADRDIGDVAVDPRLSAEQFGDRLTKALLEGDAGRLYVKSRNDAVARDRGVRLWLSLGKAPGLMSVPWEFLYLQPTFLASQRRTPIVRFLQTDAPIQPRHIDSSVEMLGVIASPTDLPPLDVEEERKRIDLALAKVRETRPVNITWLDPATPDALRRKLQEGDYHILHFVGHSGFTGDEKAAAEAVTGSGVSMSDAGGVIYLENDDRTKAPFTDTQLAMLLGDHNLRLVVLNSCEGARSNALDPFAGIATSIVGLGTPAVLAMQFEISDKAAIAFADELYQSLIVRQEPIDVAVAEARKAVFTGVNETEWATPVLFLRNADGKIFEFDPVPPIVDDHDGKTDQPSWFDKVLAPITDHLRTAAVAALAGAAVVAVLFGGVSGLIGGGGASPSPSGSSGLASASPTASVAPKQSNPPSPTPTAPPPTGRPSFHPLTADDLVTGITAADLRWIGPRVKSNMLAVTGGPTTDATNVSAVGVPEPGTTASPATQGSNAVGVVDYDPAWDPRAGVLAFARLEDGQSEIRYVVPKTGLMPDGKADTGINVKDLQTGSREGRYDHAPAWRGDRNLLFARALACPNGPGPDCREDIRLATVGERRGDYFAPIKETTPYSRAWGDVRNIAVDPRDDGRILITGINRSSRSPIPEFGVWLVFGIDQRTLLPGSERATRAIFASDGSIVAIETGSRPGWGPTILQWTSSGRGDPTRIDVASIVGATLPADTEFASISLSPTGDGRFAVLATDPEAVRTGRPPTIAILDGAFNLLQVFEPVPPAPPDKPTVWSVLTGLAW
jgi:hypothetical protein